MVDKRIFVGLMGTREERCYSMYGVWKHYHKLSLLFCCIISWCMTHVILLCFWCQFKSVRYSWSCLVCLFCRQFCLHALSYHPCISAGSKLSGACYAVRFMLHISNTDTLKSICFAYFHSLMKNGIIMGVIHLTV